MRSGTIAFLLGICALHGLEGLPGLWTAALFPAALLVAVSHRAAAAGWFVAGFLWASLNAHDTIASRLPAALDGEDLVLTGRIASIPAVAARRIRFDFTTDSGFGAGSHRVRLSWYASRHGDPPVLTAGETWRLVVRLRSPRGYLNPGGFDYETWLFGRGYAAQGYVRSGDPRIRKVTSAAVLDPDRVRHDLTRSIRAIAGLGPAGALVEALTVGVRDRISERQREVLQRTGTAHLLAISGLHIGLAAGLGFAVGRYAGPWLVPGLTPLRLGAGLGMTVAAGYAALAGFSLPTRRALVMAVVLLGALCARRRLTGSTVFCLSLAAVLVLEPSAVLAPGFWLSFCAVAMLLYGLGGRPDPGGSALHWRRWALPQFVVTVGLAPLVLHWFAEQPLVGPVANAVAIPFVAVVVLPAVLAGSLLLSLPGALTDTVGELMLTAGTYGLDALWRLLEFLTELAPRYVAAVEPTVFTTFLAMVGTAILLAPPGLPGRWTGALWFAPLLWWTPAVPGPGEVKAAFLDVGHGLAVVVETREHVLLYDTGTAHAARTIASYLGWRGRRRVDTVVVSHADADHIGGFAALAPRFPPRRVLANHGVAGAQPCAAGLSWSWNDVAFDVLHPPSPRWRGNDGSCVLRISASGRTLLLTGDIETGAERRMLGDSRELRADIVQVPHHGSRTSSGPAFLDAIGARHAVFSARHGNSRGSPDPVVLARYRMRGAAIHRTDRHGAVIVTIRSDGAIDVSHTRPRRLWHAR